MNCKIDDIARIIGGFPENVNKLVLVRAEHARGPGHWIVEVLQPLRSNKGPKPAGSTAHCQDALLRPLNDKPGNEDWFIAAPTEKKVTA